MFVPFFMNSMNESIMVRKCQISIKKVFSKLLLIRYYLHFLSKTPDSVEFWVFILHIHLSKSSRSRKFGCLIFLTQFFYLSKQIWVGIRLCELMSTMSTQMYFLGLTQSYECTHLCISLCF